MVHLKRVEKGVLHESQGVSDTEFAEEYAGNPQAVVINGERVTAYRHPEGSLWVVVDTYPGLAEKAQVRLSVRDKEVISKAIECLDLYQQLMAALPEEQWQAVSLANPVIWRQIEEQREFLQEIVDTGSVSVPETA